MNAERRAAAIEAGAKALDPMAWDDDPWDAIYGQRDVRQRTARRDAAAVIEVALLHLVGEPIGFAVAVAGDDSDLSVAARGRDSAFASAAMFREAGRKRACVVALVPVEDES